ncbi:MAG: NAD(P)-binding domain-containing protein [Chloroflexi bacterium]|nr:NAD(P)-binding domain-containing protein [Chloroflexota bacterium]
MRIAFIGGGNMGEVMLAAVLNKKLASAKDIIASDISEPRRQYLAQKYAVSVLSDNRQTIINADVIILAVKPQTLANVITELNGNIKPNQMVLSIIAGAKIDTLQQGLNHKSLVRAMPNTPAQIGEGVTVWTSTAEVTDQQKKAAGNILGVMGREFYVDEERFLDMATAVSGSGPA